MKKKLLRIIICFLFLGFGLEGDVNAQMVYLPDTNFRNALISQGLGSCIIGDSIDASCSLVLSTTFLNIDNMGIYDITGISVFVNLSTLSCHHNNLSALPIFTSSLGTLICSENNLSSLTTLPPYLGYLNCGGNHLVSISALPSNLSFFDCTSNQLVSLPALPPALSSFYCSFNLLTSLPNLPNNLGIFYCDNNLLTSLPTLPSGLVYFGCSGNQINNLPTLPTNLHSLDCQSNQLTYLPLLPITLETLFCDDNQLTSLPSLPSSIGDLYCSNNQLTLLPTLPSGLLTLSCGFNQLTSIPSLPLQLINLFCYNNQLTSLPDLNPSLDKLLCHYNPNLTCLPKLHPLSQLKFYSTSISCVPNYVNVSVACNPPLASVPLCDAFNINGCYFYWNVTGQTFIDADTNCAFDSSEIALKNIPISFYHNGILEQQVFTIDYGSYSLKSDSLGTYETKVDTNTIPFDVLCPAGNIYSDSLTTSDSLKTNRDFSLQCKNGFDVGVQSIYGSSFRPAHFTTLKIQAGDLSNFYGAHCATGESGIVSIILNNNLTYISPAAGALTPTTISGDTLTYTVSDFGTLNFAGSFDIVVQTDSLAVSGTQICISVEIATINTDNDTTNNYLQHCFIIVNSFDPNNKQVFPDGKIFIPGDRWLTYTINFQNTGTAVAHEIYISDTLDESLDISSFQLLDDSHQPIVQVKNNGAVRFNFPNINLPDSVSDEPASHGYVQYRVMLKDSLALGTVISNTSYIYFDFNAPVQTNTVVDTLTDCSNLAAINVINQTFCAGDALMLDAGLAYPAATDWYVDSVFVSGNQNISVPNLSIGNHEIKLLVSNAYCNSEVVSNVEIHSLPLVDLGNDTSTCNLPVILDAGIGNVSYQWNNGETTQTIIANATANYSVVVTDSNGCLNADTISITVNALPAKPTITQNISLLTSSSAAGNQWLMNGSLIAGAINNTYNVTLTGWYSVMVTDSNGCSNLSDSIYMDLSGVSDVLGSQDGIRIVPNPAKDEFRVLGLEFRVGDVVTVTDALGKVVYRIKIGQAGSNLKVETSGFNPGVYFVNVKTGAFSVVLKLVKE